MRSMPVVVLDVLGEDDLKMPAAKHERSRHSRRTVPANRSAMAFAREARVGVLMTPMPSPPNGVEG